MEKTRYTGKGIGVAVLDTGIYPHVDFSGRIWAFRDFISGRRAPYDDNSHGTHVSGIIGGDGTGSGGRITGIAPGCGLIVLKVLDHMGNGKKEDVLKACAWISENKIRYGIRVVNISVGTTCRTVKDHRILIRGVEKLWDEGMVVVAAAGNQGPRPGSITAPGSSRKIITVGCSDMLMGKEAISGRGPTFECICKPDIVAPGSHIMSCAPGPDNGYGRKSGTSMSTPLVSGACALMLEKNPFISNVEIKMKLMESAQDLGLPKNLQGWGKLDLVHFIEQ
ncbi:MAG: S8 family peptidase [Clostridia bacterium]|nr:S8 family peptidase [Clostridia bacterium]MDY5555093.1 S8 family peptidase [Blautia sp.]